MSLVIEKFIICDNCGENFGLDKRNSNMTVSKIRESAKRNDWKYYNGNDLCPDCHFCAPVKKKK